MGTKRNVFQTFGQQDHWAHKHTHTLREAKYIYLSKLSWKKPETEPKSCCKSLLL